MAGKKKSTPIPLQSLDALFGTTSEEQAGIQQIFLNTNQKVKLRKHI